MQIHWHGRDGKGGKDIGKDHSILTIQIRALLPAVLSDARNDIKARPAQMAKVLRLLPGINDNIAAADWAEAKKLALVAHYVAEGHLEEINVQTLVGMDLAKAKALIAETIDMKLLAKWRAAEPAGSDNAKAIDDHLAKLKAPIDPPAKK